MEIKTASVNDLPEIVNIYNYYVENTAVTFDTTRFTPENRLPWFHAHQDPFAIWTITEKDKIIGYSSLSRYKPKPAYDSTAEVSLYLHPEFTGKGYGRIILKDLICKGTEAGFHVLLSLITSENKNSIALHRKLGFEKCGEVKEAGRKSGRFHSVVFMQKILD